MGLHVDLISSLLQPKRDPTTDFLMSYMMQNPYEA
jgi:hypothetical protein